MEYQLIDEIKYCEHMINFHTEYLEKFQNKKKLFVDLQGLLTQRTLFMDSEANTIMSREGSDNDDSISSSCSSSCCNDDDASITSNAEDCLLDEINSLKQELYNFKTHVDKAIKKIDSGFDLITGGCIASV